MSAKAQLRWENGQLLTMGGQVLDDNIGLDKACLDHPDVVIVVKSTRVRPTTI